MVGAGLIALLRWAGETIVHATADQPPPIGLIAWIARHLFGDWLIGLRLFPALAGAATVWLTGKLAREMGGGAFAQMDGHGDGGADPKMT